MVKAFIPFIPPDEINKNFHRLHAPENVKAILETGKVDVDCFCSGATKLYQAARARKPDLIKLLLEYGADPNKRCDTDKLRRRYDDDDSAMEILQSADCERGPTPLHAFAGLRLGYDYNRNTLHGSDKERAAECLRVLLEAGADVNATMDDEKDSGQDMTPLHCATQKREESLFGSWGGLDQTEQILTELLLQAGANPNAKTKNGNTPLHLANPEKLRLFEILVEGGADTNAVNAWGRTPLLEMISRHRLGYSHYQSPSNSGNRPNVKIFERLLELGADVLVADHQGDTVFHHIMHNIRSFTNAEFIPFVEKLLCAGGADLLNKRNKKDQPPLWKYMCCGGSLGYNDDDEGLLQLLVDTGMDLNARDEEGRMILWVLCTRYGTEVRTIEKLVRLGADPGALTHEGKTLLHAVPHRPEWLRYLISAGARPEAVDKDGNTIIHAMLRGTADASSYAPEVLRVLVGAGAQPLAKNAKGQSALHVAGGLRNLEIVLSTPVFRGLDVNEPDVDGFTPLHHAVRLGENAVWKLVCAGADPTALAAGGTSPLHIAARSREPGVVGLLLAQYRKLSALETHVNLLDGDGRTPLHYACRSGSPEAVWTLLRNGADARITDEKGLTPLHALAEFEPPEKPLATDPLPRADDIVGMLQLAGADLDAEAVVQAEDETTPRTLTPLGLAVEKGFWELVRGLVTHGAEPSDDHRLSPDFVLATDRNRAADAARKAQASVPPRGRDFSNSRRGRGRPWRGRWAACPGAKMPLEEGTRFITGGQDILDAKVQDGSGEKNGGKLEVNDKVYGVDILYGVLRDGDYDTIKEYALLGGDMLELDQWQDHTFLHHLVKEGHADLLEYFGSYVTELESQEWVQKDEQSCGTLLGTACERTLPSLHVVQTLVDKLGVDVNAVYNRLGACYKLRGATALHILASGSNFWQVEALEYLISKGADIEARNSGGMTPLLAAIDKQYPDGFWPEETVRVLLGHGADVNATVKATGTVSRGLSALETSSSPGITKLLLAYGASVENCPGMLTRAVREWMEPGIVELLLDAGLDPNELSSLQEQLHEEDHFDEMDESAEDDGDGEEADGHTDKTNVGLRYPLHEAARPTTHWNPPVDFELRQQAVIDLLLSRGAHAYAPYPDSSFVLQAIVEDRGQVHSFLPGLSRTNCNVRGHHGRTLLASACIPVIPVGPETTHYDTPNPQTVMVDVVHALLGCGADPLLVDDEGRTPLHWLCTFPGPFNEAHRNAFVALARHGPAAIEIPDKQGRKPLHLALATYATRSQHSPFAIQHLLSVGADPADPDPVTGNSALHFVAPRLVGESTAAAAATALFRELATARSVDINARNGQGETPVFAFAAAGWEATHDPERKVGNPTYALAHDTTHAKALDVFVDLGADLAAVDARRRTLLHVTAWRGSPNGGTDYVEREDVVGAFKRLMELGVDPRAEDDGLRTAIDVAVARNWSGIVLLFSEEGKRMEEEKRARREKEADGESGSDIDSEG